MTQVGAHIGRLPVLIPNPHGENDEKWRHRLAEKDNAARGSAQPGVLACRLRYVKHQQTVASGRFGPRTAATSLNTVAGRTSIAILKR